MIKPTTLRYSVEVQNLEDADKWAPVALRLTIDGARYEISIQRRDDPSRVFRVVDHLTQQTTPE